MNTRMNPLPSLEESLAQCQAPADNLAELTDEFTWALEPLSTQGPVAKLVKDAGS